MRSLWNEIVWHQFGAAISALENAIVSCPEDLWSDRSQRPEFWYVAFHALFYLDLYLSPNLDGFRPPRPFTLTELDASGCSSPSVFTTGANSLS